MATSTAQLCFIKKKLPVLFSFFFLTTALVAQLPTANAATAVQPIEEIFTPVQTYDPTVYGKVAVLQWNPPGSTPLGVSDEAAENYKQKNREALAAFIRQAAQNGARLVVTSELVIDGYPYEDYQTRADLTAYVETIPGPSTAYFSQLARELKIWIHVGLAEVDRSTSKFYNAAVVLSPEGTIVAHYRKRNLFKEESNYFTPGNSIATYQSEFGKIGVLICADVYSLIVIPQYKLAGVDVLSMGASWVEPNTGMGYFGRAAEIVGSFFLAANQMYAPDSGVINPDGSLQSHIRQSSGLAYGYLPLKFNRKP
jgi:predicted amidohydrolase